MRITSTAAAPTFPTKDIYGEPITIGANAGHRTLLCFFRDAGCPFCNFRVHLLTSRHKALQRLGLDVVAVFASDADAVKRFVARTPRPFRVVADPEMAAYDAYGVEQSLWGKLKAIATRIPDLIKGLRFVGLAGLNTNNVMPADFLIDESGKVVEAYYGSDAGDHIPMERIELFAARGVMWRAEQADNADDEAAAG